MALTRRAFLVGLGATALGATALGATGCASASPRALSIATGEPGGTYIRFGELLRDSLRARGAADLGVLESNGSLDNLALLRSGGADLALSLADAAAGEAGAGDVVAIGRVYQNSLQCIARADGPVSAARDLADARISLGAPGSGAAFTADRVLRALGLPRAARTAVADLTLHESIEALEADRIDAFFWSGGLPTPEIEALDARTGVRLVDLRSAMPALDDAHPLEYAPVAVPRGVYGGRAIVTTVGVSNLLLARPSLDDGVAARLVDALVEDARALVPAGSVGVQYLTAATLLDTAPLALHPGAERRYRERYG